jgi:hypothetical protein
VKPTLQVAFATLLLGAALLLLRAGVRVIRRTKWDRLSLAVLVGTLLVSFVVAWYSSTELTLHLKPTMRWQGFPLPVAIFALEGEIWVDYVGASWLQSWYAFVNFVSVLSCGVALASFSSKLSRNTTRISQG